MKKLILFVFFCLLSTSLFAQVQLVGTNPANGAVAVDQDSIVLEFNQPVMVDIEDPEWSGFFFFIEPELTVTHNGISLSDDLTKVIIYVDLSPDTDYLMGIGGIQGVSGEKLDTPHLIQFTTYAEAGAYTVTGTVPEGENGVAVFLSMSPFDFNFGFDEDFDEGEEEDFIPVYGATIDTTTGDYVISGVRENTYFPVGLNIFQVLDESQFSEFFFPDIYIYDPDEDITPNEIMVNAETTTNDTLSGIDLTKLDFTTFTFSEAITKAQSVINGLENDPVLVGGATYYFGFQDYEDEVTFEKKRNTSFAPGKLELPSFTISKPGFFGSENRSMFRAKAIDEENFLESPDGTHIMWELYLYDAVKDSAASVLVTPFGTIFMDYFGAEEADLPEGVDFSDIKPLPESFIDSDAAVDIFLTEGISDLIAEYNEFGPSTFGGWYFDLTGLHLFWEYEPNPTTDAPVMWIGSFEGFKYDFENEQYSEEWLTIYLDIQTGDVLHSEGGSSSSDNTPILFSDAYAFAQSTLTELENNPIILGGYTYYYNEYEYFEKNKAGFTPTKQVNSSRSVFMNKNLKTKSNVEPEPGFQHVPNGYQTDWELFGYDAVKDSVIYLYITASGVQYLEYIDAEDAELPEGYTVADMNPVPETYIDSDQAVAIMESAGGEAFRAQFSINNESEYSSWDMDLTALHAFWEYPDDPTPSAPVLWVGNYYGYYYNYETNESNDGYLIIILDIENGDVIYTESGSDTSSSTPLLFSEALAIAAEVLDGLENSPVFVGGSTSWYYQYEPFKNHPEALSAKINSRAKQRMAKSASQNTVVVNSSNYPDGYQNEWDFYGYDAVKDSALGIYVYDGEASFFGYIGYDEADLPEGVTFGSIKPLPETYIDSDQAASIIEDEGGAAFREEFGFDTESGYGYWDMWLDALHAYWDYPLDPTPDAPVMWVANYYGYKYDFDTDEITEDSLIVFLDIQTGEVLHKMPTSSEVKPGIPADIRLLQNYPNPFNPSTHIPFELNKASKVELSIYNMLGQKVATLVNDAYPAGSHSFTWNASGFASGVYFYRLEAGGVIQTRKLLLLK